MLKDVPEINSVALVPKKHLKEVKRQRSLSKAEYDKIDKALTEKCHSAVLQLLVYTGMCQSEALALRKDWINWDRGTFGEIRLPHTKTKNKEPRIIPMFENLRRTLEEECARNVYEYVFSRWHRYLGEYVP